MNEKEPPFSPVFYILLHFLFSFPVLLPSCESSGLGVVMRDGQWWSRFDGELSERAAFRLFLSMVHLA